MNSAIRIRANAWLAFGLSILVPGLGQLYAGRRLRGGAWFIGWLGAWYGCLSWIFSEERINPAEGAGWYLALLLVGVASWFDACRVAGWPGIRRHSRPLAPGAGFAFSLLFPGLGHIFLLVKRSVRAGWWGVPLLVAAAMIFLAGSLENAPLPGWPNWLAGWPPLLGAFAGAGISAAALIHAYTLGFRAGGGAGHAPRLPRFSPLIWALAISSWLAGHAPWQAWLQARVRSFYIPSSSMEPTLKVGDRILAKRQKEFVRGQMVVFQLPDQPAGEYMVKRVAGCPGEEISLRDGRLLVNGRFIREEFLKERAHYAGDFGPFRVPAESYFLLGDSRAASRDSRYFGAVPAGRIYGRVYKRYWPFPRTAAFVSPG